MALGKSTANLAPEGRPNLAQRRGPQHARFWRDGVEGFSAGKSGRNDSSPGGRPSSDENMIYPIVKFGNPVLDTPAAEVTSFDDDLKKLIEDMFESMYAARGVGLAAPQIGLSKRIAVVDVTFKEDPAAKLVLINPVIISKEGRQRSSEGCLSIPEFREDVTRAKTVTVRAQDVTGKFFERTGEDLLARALLHETDHLNGKLYISHVSALKRDLIKRKIRKLVKGGEW
jgi:peptide deformylase